MDCRFQPSPHSPPKGTSLVCEFVHQPSSISRTIIIFFRCDNGFITKEVFILKNVYVKYLWVRRYDIWETFQNSMGGENRCGYI